MEILFNFWGTKVKLQINSILDYNHFTFYFKEYIIANNITPHILIKLIHPLEKSFISSMDHEKMIHIVYLEDYIEEFIHGEEFKTHSSIIPPFSYHKFLKEYMISHGACVSKKDLCIAILGDSGSGKTSAMFTLVLLNKFNFITDDLIIRSKSTGKVQSFLRPISIRPKTRKIFTKYIEKDIYRDEVYFSDWGKVHLLSPRDMSCDIDTNRVINYSIELQRGKYFIIKKRSSNQISITWDPDKHIQNLSEVIEGISNGKV